MSRIVRCLAAAALLVGTALAGACQTTPSEVEEAPLGEAGQKKLRNALVGSWRKAESPTLPGQQGAQSTGTASSQQNEAGGNQKDGDTIIWTFAKDGTGSKTTKSSPDADGNEQSFQLHLEGRNIVVEFDDAPKTEYFRAETWSAAQMQWHHYVSGERRTLKKYGE
jgi:hypothetical protein